MIHPITKARLYVRAFLYLRRDKFDKRADDRDAATIFIIEQMQRHTFNLLVRQYALPHTMQGHIFGQQCDTLMCLNQFFQ